MITNVTQVLVSVCLAAVSDVPHTDILFYANEDDPIVTDPQAVVIAHTLEFLDITLSAVCKADYGFHDAIAEFGWKAFQIPDG